MSNRQRPITRQNNTQQKIKRTKKIFWVKITNKTMISYDQHRKLTNSTLRVQAIRSAIDTVSLVAITEGDFQRMQSAVEYV